MGLRLHLPQTVTKFKLMYVPSNKYPEGKFLCTIIAHRLGRDPVISDSASGTGLQLTQTISVPPQNPVTARRWFNGLIVRTKFN